MKHPGRGPGFTGQAEQGRRKKSNAGFARNPKKDSMNRPLEDSLKSPRSLRKAGIFSFLRVAVMKKDLPPLRGSLLFIYTGSVDMNIRFLPSALLSAGPASLGLRRPGVRYSFSSGERDS